MVRQGVLSNDDPPLFVVVQVKVEGEMLKDVEGWKELLQVNYETFYFDKTQRVLWLKLINHTSAVILLNSVL